MGGPLSLLPSVGIFLKGSEDLDIDQGSLFQNYQSRYHSGFYTRKQYLNSLEDALQKAKIVDPVDYMRKKVQNSERGVRQGH